VLLGPPHPAHPGVRPQAQGKQRRRPRHPYVGGTLGESAASAGRTKTFLGAKLRRLCRHMPKKKALVAVMRTQLVIAHALLSAPEAAYRELGPGYYEQRSGTRSQARSHIRSLERLGYEVTVEPLRPEQTPRPANSSPRRQAKPRRRSRTATSRRHKPPPAQTRARLRSHFRARVSIRPFW